MSNVLKIDGVDYSDTDEEVIKLILSMRNEIEYWRDQYLAIASRCEN
jgi:hypothetical protein